jgi:hypothetical protein
MGMKIPFNTFSTGEIAESLASRYDLAKYKPACKVMKNFLVELHGNARRRPGTYFLEDLGADSVLIPFQFSSDPAQCLVMIFSNLKVRFATTAGFIKVGGVPIELVTSYTTAQLIDLSYAQSGDVVYLAHKSHALRKLSRTSSTSFTLDTVTFDPVIAAPTISTVVFTPGPVASGAVVAPVDYTLSYKAVAVDAKGEASYASAAVGGTARHPSDWIQGDKVTVTLSAVSGASEYLIYREEGGYYGLVGVTETTAFIDVKYVAETSKTPFEAKNPFADNNHPGLVSFHEQRLVLGGAALFPQTIYASQTGNYKGFFKRTPTLDDDPYEFTIASGSIDAVNWMASFGDLLIGTGSAEHQMTGGNDPITPSNVQVKQQSYWGSTRIPPLVIGNSVLHVQKQGAHVRDLFYSLEKDGYAGNDLTILAPHLFEGYTLRQWAYQQAPGSVIWVVRNDGLLLALTYMKEHDIWAWSRHDTDGQYRSVCSITGEFEDNTFFVVKRTVNGSTKYYLELMQQKWTAPEGIEDAFFVDCGLSYYGAPATVISGLGHLEGKAVAVLADGSPVEGLTVASGSVTLPYAAATVHVGLPYTSILAPMPSEAEAKDGTTLGRMRTVGLSRIRVLDTVGGKFGSSETALYDFPYLPDNWGEAVPPYSGDLEMSPDTQTTSQTTVYITQDRPLPMTIVALILDVDYEG